MNFDGAELAYEDGPHAVRRRGTLRPGRATVLRQLRVRGGGPPTGASRRMGVARPQRAGETENEIERLATSAESVTAFLFSLSRLLEKTDERYDGVGVREMVVNTVTVARVSNRSVRERKNDVLLVVPRRRFSSAPARKHRGEMSSARYQIHWAASQWYAALRRTTCPIAGNGK